eukprot:gene28673-35576_t
MASNVRCIVEDHVIPGVTLEDVTAQIEKIHGTNGASLFVGRKLSGWYFQQFLKMGVARHLPDLSQHYLLWDSDMVPLKPMQLFSGRDNKTVVYVGGHGPLTYLDTYERLFGPIDKNDLSNPGMFVTHQMLIHRPYMDALLHNLTSKTNDQNSWIEKILSSVDSAKNWIMGINWLHGTQYLGFELGHVNVCNYNADKFQDQYGL